jgi:hypothetical protein
MKTKEQIIEILKRNEITFHHIEFIPKDRYESIAKEIESSQSALEQPKKQDRLRMRRHASDVFELTKGFTSDPTPAGKTLLQLAHDVMVLTNDLDGQSIEPKPDTSQVDQKPTDEETRQDFCLWYYAQSQPLDANKVFEWFFTHSLSVQFEWLHTRHFEPNLLIEVAELRDSNTMLRNQVQELLEKFKDEPNKECVQCDNVKETHSICGECLNRLLDENKHSKEPVSDDDIEKAAKEYFPSFIQSNHLDKQYGFEIGAKAMRDGLIGNKK